MQAQLTYSTRNTREGILIREINKLSKFDKINMATMKPKKKRISKFKMLLNGKN